MSFSSPEADDVSSGNMRASALHVGRAAQSGQPADPQLSILNGGVRKALGLEPEDLPIGLRVAANRMRRGAAAEALRVYVALVLCEPTNPEFQIGLSNCALQLGEYCLALQAASVVIACAPSNARGFYLSGRACLALGHRAEAEEDLGHALELAKKNKEGNLFSDISALLAKLTALRSE